MLEKLEALLPTIAERADDIERQRSIPDELLAQLHRAKAFRLLLPETVDGGSVRFEDYLSVIEKLGGADASTAWCVNQASVLALSTLWLPADQIADIWSDDQAAIANGPPFRAEVEAVDAGYRLSGHWGFSSGCQHATWMMAPARLKGPTPKDAKQWRIVFCRPAQVTFCDNWQVRGLSGTGSFEFRCDQLAVPQHQVADQGASPTVDFELTQVSQALLFGVSFAALALGVAGAACDDTRQIAQAKLPRYARSTLRDDPDAHRFFGQSTARHRAARAYLHQTVGEVLERVRQHGSITENDRAALRLVATHVIRESAAVLDLSYKIAGTTGIYQNETLQRRFQDLHVITQHVQARESFYGLVGRYLITGDYQLGPMT